MADSNAAAFEAERDFVAAILDTVDVIIVVLDTEGRILRFNRAAERLTSYRFPEVKGRSFAELFLTPEEREAVLREFSKILAGEFPHTYENDWVTRDGVRRRIAWSNTALRDEQGRVRHVIGTGVDITERKRAEAALGDSEVLFRELAEHIQEVFWFCSLDRRKLYYVSPAFEKIWGRARSEVYANPMNFLASIHPHDRAALISAVERQQREGLSGRVDEEYRIVRPDGSVRWIATRYFPVRNHAGEPTRIAGFSADITDRKLNEERRLGEMQAQRDTLVREVHHRIKNNLQAVAGLLRRHAQAYPNSASAVDEAVGQIQTIAIVHGVQGVSPYEEPDLCVLVRNIAEAVQQLTGASIAPSVELGAGTPIRVASAEAVPVALILNELVTNAIKHSTDGARPIRITVQREGQAAIVRIVNPGERLPAGFDFAQGKKLGTGLQLVKSLLPPSGATLSIDCIDGEIQSLFTIEPPNILP